MLDSVYKRLVLGKGYVYLFKAAIHLFVGATIVFGNFLFFIYDREMAAYEKKYEIESVLKKNLDCINCEEVGVMRAQCSFVKHQVDTLSSLSSVCQKVLNLLLLLGLLLMLISAICFVAELIDKPKHEV